VSGARIQADPRPTSNIPSTISTGCGLDPLFANSSARDRFPAAQGIDRRFTPVSGTHSRLLRRDDRIHFLPGFSAAAH
jgi:hypothetical protein